MLNKLDLARRRLRDLPRPEPPDMVIAARREVAAEALVALLLEMADAVERAVCPPAESE